MQKYGINLTEPLTASMVRDVIVNCFATAHCEDSGVGSSDQDINLQYCRDLVAGFF